MLDVKLWNQSQSELGEMGLLTKLHGSVDWQRGQRSIHTGTPLFSGEHERHLIIYPGFKGRPAEPEIRAFHAHFGRALEAAVGVVFIGFAFRDDYLNELFEQHLNASASVVLLNPDDTIKVPIAENRLRRITEHFNSETATKVAHNLIF